MTALPDPRADLGLREGYHSPQVDVEVRLNTNESPLPPPPGWLEALHRELDAIPWNRYPDRAATGVARRPGRPAPRAPRPGLLRQRLQRGAAVVVPGLRRAGPVGGGVRADLCPALAHRPPHRDRGGRRPASPRLFPGSGPGTRPAPGGATGHHLPLLPQQSRPGWPTTRRPCGRCSPPRPDWSWSTRPTASSPTGRRSLVDDDDPTGGDRAPSPRRGRWRPPGSVTWSGPAAVVATLERVALPYHLDALKQAAGRLAVRFVGEMESGWGSSSASGSGSWRLSAGCR